MHDVSNGLDRVNRPRRDVTTFIFRFDAAQSSPRADIVPAEIAGEHAYSSTALEHTDIDRYRCDSLVIALGDGRRIQRDGNFRSNSPNLSEKITNSPNENARVPEISFVKHPFRP